MTSTEMSGSQLEELNLFYEEVRQHHSRPLWLATDQPQPKVIPFMWRWREFRPLMFRAAQLVPIEHAERRVLVFANPGLLGRPSATSTLLANLQIINPGEIAPTHRHTASAFRLIVEGVQAYTTVEGEKTYMEPGDFVTTPNWTWHDHGNEGDQPVIWLDGLDGPLVSNLEASFREEYPESHQPLTRADNLSQRLYGAGTLMPTWERGPALHSPLLNYTYKQSYEVLSRLARETEGSPYDGVCVEYTNPRTGGSTLAIMACFAQLLLPGQRTRAHRHTGGTIHHVIKGQGYSVIDGERFDWQEKDTFVVPSWAFHEHAAQEEAVLFSYNDSPVLQPLGLYREEAYQDDDGHQKVTGVFSPKSAE